jgi:hypothetical protein
MTEKKENENKDQEKDPFDIKTFSQYANSNDFLSLYGFYNNPIWRNEILKQLSSSPVKYDKEKVAELTKNPVQNEKALKDLSQYLMNNSNHFKRIVHYFATILDFRHILVPLDSDETKPFLKSYKKALDWLNKFNVEYEFSSIMQTLILEDTGFYYVRENGNTVTLQRMPTDYCKIVDKTELGYQYAFNMVYFMRPGVSLDAFAPEFQQYYQDFENGDKNVPFYWKDLPPEKAFVFKWDENFAGIIPVLIGLYLDTVEIEEYKQLFKSKTVLENWKILFQKIPMRQGDQADKNDFLIDPDIAGKFQGLIKQALPSGTTVISSPMDVEAVNFENASNSNNYVGFAEQNFFSSAGVPPILFGGATDSSAGVSQSIIVDENFVRRMYFQFARFINFHLNKASGKYKFVIDFMGSTKFNQQQQIDNAVKVIPIGMPIDLMSHAVGLKPGYLDNLLVLEKMRKTKDMMRPPASSHTQSDNNGGRPSKSDDQLDTSGVKSRDNGDNDPDKRN